MKRFNFSFAGLLTLLYLLFSNPASAVNYYWVGGSGNWSDYGNHWAITSGGSIFHTTIPTFADNVFFDANSFSADSQVVTLDNTFIYCNNMDWTGVQYAVALETSTSIFSIYPLNIYGSLILNPNVYEFYSVVHFTGSTQGAVINTAGVEYYAFFEIDGTGTWELMSDLKCKGLTVNSGTFNSNNHTFWVNGIRANSIANPIVNMGTSEIHCESLNIGNNPNFDGDGCNLFFDSPIDTDLNCDNHTFKNIYFQADENEIWGSVTADSIFFFGEAKISPIGVPSNFLSAKYLYLESNAVIYSDSTLNSTVNKVVAKQRLAISGGITFDTLLLDNPGSELYIYGMLYITDSLNVAGNCTSFSHIRGSTVGTARIVKYSGTISLDYARVKNIEATGGATFIADNSFDDGGNTGWQFNTPVSRDLYWVNGQGNWSDASHWSLVSGGAGGNCPPNTADNVFFDSLSFVSTGDTVVLDQFFSYCDQFSLNAPGFFPVITNPDDYMNWQYELQVNASMLLLTNAITKIQFTLTSGDPGNLLQTGSNTPRIVITGPGEWSLTEDINCDELIISKGNFNSNNYTITTNSFSAGYSSQSPKPDINLGTSTIHCYHFFTAQIDTHLISANADLIFDQLPSSAAWGWLEAYNQIFNNINFPGNGKAKGTFTCHTLDFNAKDSLIATTVYIDKLLLNDDSYISGSVHADTVIQSTPGKQFHMGFSTIYLGDVFDIDGVSCDEMTEIISLYSGTFNKASGTVDLDFVTLKNINGTGGATFNATNAIDAGGNSGWNISIMPSRDLFWVGGSGNWSDQANWATSSGGAGGNCLPNLTDRVYFDDNSFFPLGTETIMLDLEDISCYDFNYSVSYPNKHFQIGSESLNIYGSLNFTTQADLLSGSPSQSNDIFLRSDSLNATILTTGTFLNKLHIACTGSYELLDSLSCYLLSSDEGNLVTSNNAIDCEWLQINSSLTGIDFGSSNLYCQAFWCDSAGPGINSQDLSIFNILALHSNNQPFHSISTVSLSSYGGFSCDWFDIGSLHLNPDDTSQQYYIQSGTLNSLSINNTSSSVLGFKDVLFDTLTLNSSGTLIEVRDGLTLRINDTLIVNNSAAFPTELKVFDYVGDHFYIEMPSGVLCMENMIMEGVHTLGNANFFAGSNSVNLGNNQGWIYNSCNPNNSDVWPGDANYDLIVDNFDVLHVGLAYNAVDTPRAGASNNWVGQPAVDWPFQFANGANLKNADCDGSGTVDNNDTTAIYLNYGLTHPPRLFAPEVSSVSPLQLFVVANPDTVAEGDTVQIEVHLGTPSTPVDSIYGIAFSLVFDTTMIDTSYVMTFDYSGSWMGVQGVDLLNFEKQFLPEGRVDIAITRTDHLNISGDGIVLTTGVVIVDNIGARLFSAPPFVTLPIQIENPRAVTASEFYLAVNTEHDSVAIDSSGFVSLPEDLLNGTSVKLYPNPARDYVRLSSDKYKIHRATLFNQFGDAIRSWDGNSHNMVLSLDGITSSVYIVKLDLDAGTVYKKLVLTERKAQTNE